jgi:hypothetical protein
LRHAWLRCEENTAAAGLSHLCAVAYQCAESPAVHFWNACQIDSEPSRTVIEQLFDFLAKLKFTLSDHKRAAQVDDSRFVHFARVDLHSEPLFCFPTAFP